jgi:hypothetical protein
MRAAAVLRHIRRHWPVCRTLRAQAVSTPAVWPEWVTRVFLTVTRFLQFVAPRTNADGSSIKSAMGMLVRRYQDRPVSATVRRGYSPMMPNARNCLSWTLTVVGWRSK